MIIDTESPEGRALVALAKFGHKCLHEFITDEHAEDFGLMREIEDCHGHKYWVPTDLAKLPEGI